MKSANINNIDTNSASPSWAGALNMIERRKEAAMFSTILRRPVVLPEGCTAAEMATILHGAAMEAFLKRPMDLLRACASNDLKQAFMRLHDMGHGMDWDSFLCAMWGRCWNAEKWTENNTFAHWNPLKGSIVLWVKMRVKNAGRRWVDELQKRIAPEVSAYGHKRSHINRRLKNPSHHIAPAPARKSIVFHNPASASLDAILEAESEGVRVGGADLSSWNNREPDFRDSIHFDDEPEAIHAKSWDDAEALIAKRIREQVA